MVCPGQIPVSNLTAIIRPTQAPACHQAPKATYAGETHLHHVHSTIGKLPHEATWMAPSQVPVFLQQLSAEAWGAGLMVGQPCVDQGGAFRILPAQQRYAEIHRQTPAHPQAGYRKSDSAPLVQWRVLHVISDAGPPERQQFARDSFGQ